MKEKYERPFPDGLPDDNDTSVVWNYGSRVFTRGMLWRERVSQGVMWLISQSHILRPTPVESKLKCMLNLYYEDIRFCHAVWCIYFVLENLMVP